MSGFAHVDLSTKTVIKLLRKHPRADGGPVVGLIPGTAVVPVTQEPRPDTKRNERAEPTETISEVGLVRGFTVVELAGQELVEAIKGHAGDLIRERYSETDQRNAVLDTLATVKPTKREKDAAKAMADYIQAVRKESAKKTKDVSDGKPVDLDDWPEVSA